MAFEGSYLTEPSDIRQLRQKYRRIRELVGTARTTKIPKERWPGNLHL
jgi:hypothetical protein